MLICSSHKPKHREEEEMEILACLFFGCWANIGVVSLFLGCEALNKTTIPASVSPAVLFLFKHFLAIAAAHSTTHTLIFRTKLKIHVVNYYALFSFTVFPIAFASIAGEAKYLKFFCPVNAFVLLYYFLPWKKRVLGDEFFYKQSVAFSLIPLLVVLAPPQSDDPSFLLCVAMSVANLLVVFQPVYAAVEGEHFCLLFHFIAMYTLLVFGYATKDFSPVLVLSTTFLTCAAHAVISGDERFQRWMPAAATGRQENRVISELKKIMKRNGNVVEFSIGMAGTILFQYFFRLTSFDHVVAFLYFAVAWLANLAVLLCRHDLGVFNFFLSNVIVGCTVSEFGVGRTTWLAYGASLILYVLRVKLHLLCVVSRDDKEAVVSWRQNQTVESDDQIV